MTEDDLRRPKELYLAERAERESPYRWVRRAYPAWRPMLHFGESVVIRQQIDRWRLAPPRLMRCDCRWGIGHEKSPRRTGHRGDTVAPLWIILDLNLWDFGLNKSQVVK